MNTIALNDAPAPIKAGLPLKAAVAIATLAAFTILITWRARVLEMRVEGEGEEPALVGQLAPDFSATTVDGRSVSLADFRGQKNVVVSFWASWCGPCRLEMPTLTKFYQTNHDASSDFEILAVSIDDDPQDARDFATAQKLNFPVLLDSKKKVADAYGVEGIPTMFIVGKDGKITYGHVGFDMRMDFQLARELGIKPKEATEGAADGNASH